MRSVDLGLSSGWLIQNWVGVTGSSHLRWIRRRPTLRERAAHPSPLPLATSAQPPPCPPVAANFDVNVKPDGCLAAASEPGYALGRPGILPAGWALSGSAVVGVGVGHE